MRPQAQARGIVVALVIVSACAGAETPAPAAQVDEAALKAELAQRMASYREAALAGDSAGMMAYWTDDAHALGPGMDMDRNGMRQYVQQFFAGGKVLSLDIRQRDLFVYPDAAYETGEYDEVLEPSGMPPDTLREYYFFRWEKQPDGTWKLDRFVGGPRAAPPTN